MHRNGIRQARAAAAVLAVLLLVGACASAGATPIALVSASPVATTAPTPTPTLGSTPTASPTKVPHVTASPKAIVTATHKPTATPTSPAAGCTGATKTKAFFAQAASKVSFAVYCAVLPKGWTLQGGSYYPRPTGTEIDAQYLGPGSAMIDLLQGANCTTSVAACSTHMAILGITKFGSLNGELDILDASPSYGVYVYPGTTHGYTMVGTGMTQTDFISFAAAMRKVPKV